MRLRVIVATEDGEVLENLVAIPYREDRTEAAREIVDVIEHHFETDD